MHYADFRFGSIASVWAMTVDFCSALINSHRYFGRPSGGTNQASWPLRYCRQPKEIVGLHCTLVGIVLTGGFVRGFAGSKHAFVRNFPSPLGVQETGGSLRECAIN